MLGDGLQRHVNKPTVWELVTEAFRSRELIVTFARRSINTQFKQTVLGWGWAVLQPLGFLTIFVVFFGEIAGVETSGSYAAFALSALVPWQFVSGIVVSAGTVLVAEANLLKKVYFPRVTAVLGKSLASGAHFAIGLTLLLLAIPVVGGRFSARLLWIPLLSVLLFFLAVAIAIPLSAVSVWFRDVRVVVPFAAQAWLFASPVAYPISSLSRSSQLIYALLNPAVGPLEGFRRVYVDATSPDFGLLGLSMVSATFIAVVGMWIFRALEPGLADVA